MEGSTQTWVRWNMMLSVKPWWTMNSWYSFSKTIPGNAFKGAVKEKPFKIATKSFLTLSSVLQQDDNISGYDFYGGVEGVCKRMFCKVVLLCNLR